MVLVVAVVVAAAPLAWPVEEARHSHNGQQCICGRQLDVLEIGCAERHACTMKSTHTLLAAAATTAQQRLLLHGTRRCEDSIRSEELLPPLLLLPATTRDDAGAIARALVCMISEWGAEIEGLQGRGERGRLEISV